MLRLGHHHPSVARSNIRVLGPNVQGSGNIFLDLFIKFAIGRFYTTREIKDKFGIPESRGSRFQKSTLRTRNCPSQEGMEGKSFEEGLAEITEMLKRLQSTLLFHQTKLTESFRQARQDFSLARRDISLATEKLHRSIKAAINEKINHEEQFNFFGVQLNQRIPNRTVKARKVKARLFWRKFIVTIDRTRRPKSIQSVVMLRLGHHHPSVARGNIRVLGLNVQRVRQHLPRLVYQVCYWPILHYKGNQRQIWDPRITWLKISKEHLKDKGVIPAIANVFPCAEHRFCLKHIHENIKKRWRGEAYKDLLWRAARATTVQHFQKAMENMKKFNEEAFNCKILDGRDMPIIAAIDNIREYLMKRIVNVIRVIKKCDGPLTPTVTRLLETVKKEASDYSVEWNGGLKYEVSGPWNSEGEQMKKCGTSGSKKKDATVGGSKQKPDGSQKKKVANGGSQKKTSGSQKKPDGGSGTLWIA
ncbi:hypothetical protein Tco_0906584 [Tanacetum coccineum]|uniref:Transposase n=1 Tax=Tanacetum coccineum TaxID=301880 RepID=A0ABQ5CN20_9ASTR